MESIITPQGLEVKIRYFRIPGVRSRGGPRNGVGIGLINLRAASSLGWGSGKNRLGPVLWKGFVKPRQAQRNTLRDCSHEGHLSRILKDK